MGEFFKQFLIRGLTAMGFGPIVLAIIYGSLSLGGVVTSITVDEMVGGIISISALAFICGGMTAIYQIERLAISKAIALHGIVLYLTYAIVYVVNGWLKDGLASFLIFTVIFVLGYALVWLIIYLITKNSTKNANIALKNRAE